MTGPTPPPVHGVAVLTRTLLDSSLTTRFDVVHLDTSDRRDHANIGRFDVTNVVLALRHGAQFLTRLVRHRPDVVYLPVAQNRLGFWRDCLFLIPSRLLRRKIVVHIHGGSLARLLEESDAATRVLARWLFRGVSRTIILADRLRPTVAGLAPDERVAVVPYGVADTREIAGVVPGPGGRAGSSRGDEVGRQADVSAGGMPGDAAEGVQRDAAIGETCHFVYLGTLMRSKGFADVLEAARLLLEEGVDARFTLAGPFGDATDRELARPYQSSEWRGRIEFAGVVRGTEKAALLRGADVFVFPSDYPYEGQPLVILEAMAAGLPVVATEHAAIPEMVVGGETGVFVPKRDPAALAAQLRVLATDPELRRRLGAAGRARYEERYTLERWTEAVGDVLQAVIREG